MCEAHILSFLYTHTPSHNTMPSIQHYVRCQVICKESPAFRGQINTPLECELVQPLWKRVQKFFKKLKIGSSLLVQWLRIHVARQGTWL